jgi:hypothetical protein
MSNNHKGGKCYDVNLENFSLRYYKNKEPTLLLKDFYSKDLLLLSLDKSILLHKTFPKYVLTIGWDVMITDNDYYFLEGNIPGGSILIDDYFFYEKSLKLNKINIHSIF